MSVDRKLAPEQLRRRCDPAGFEFETTAEIEPLERTIGQPRAVRALDFGLDIDASGYNVFASGPVGTGKRTLIEAHLRARAASRPPADDWLYLHDFRRPAKPIAQRFPAGEGRRFATEVGELVTEMRRRIPEAFESEHYQERRRDLVSEVERQREEVISGLRQEASRRGLALELTPAGLVTIPVIDGRPMRRDQIAALPAALRERIEASARELEDELPPALNRIRELERDGTRRLAELDREVAMFAAGHLLDDLRERYSHVPGAVEWLDRVREDVVEHLDYFRAGPEVPAQVPEPMASGIRQAREAFFARYEPNVLVGDDGAEGAPVVFETNPTYYNLFGRIEYEAMFGAMSTDHRHIKAGALHRANGGYLMLEALNVLREPFAWSKLKQVLRTRRLQIEPLGAQLTMLPAATLEPEPIELDVKVILIGPPLLFQQLYLLDEDVRRLFKVKADFDVQMPWDEELHGEYAAFVARRVRDEALLPFHRDAVARTIEYGARLAGDREKLSTRLSAVTDVITEASHWAGKAGRDTVRAADVDRAIDERIYRSNLLEERIRELIAEGTLMIDVAGERPGQVNGLSVARLGDYEFGRPVRITATTGLGEGDVIAIDREVELSGPIHDKGFMILAGYLTARFGGERPLSLRARLVFEQSYEEIEGDSASCAELLALLSSLSGTPIRQGIAITGSVNQHGAVQAIGGVNEKIEGFFAVCREAGLNGDQGVIIPAANVRNLMLRDEVVEAVGDGRFAIWAVSTVEEALEILTGREPGRPEPDGTYPEGTIYRAVDDRLRELSEQRRRLSGADGADGADAGGDAKD